MHRAASAHAARVSTEPAENAVLAAGPKRVSATFNDQLQTAFAAMTVVGPDGNEWSTGNPTVQGATLGIGLRPLGAAGTYTVNYRVTSDDGHVVSGSWSFRLMAPGTGTPGSCRRRHRCRRRRPGLAVCGGNSGNRRCRRAVGGASQAVTCPGGPGAAARPGMMGRAYPVR